MPMNVATREFGRAVCLPEAGISADAGSGLSKPAVSRRFKALTEARLAEWMASDLSQLDLPMTQVDGLHMDDTLLMLGAAPLGRGRCGRRQASPRRGRGGHRERRDGADPARQADRARARHAGLPAVHRRWRQGPESLL